MTEFQFIAILLSMVGGLFGILILILGWLGGKNYSKLDEISKNIVVMAAELHEKINTTAETFNERISNHDRRISVIESRCNDRHLHRQD